METTVRPDVNSIMIRLESIKQEAEQIQKDTSKGDYPSEMIRNYRERITPLVEELKLYINVLPLSEEAKKEVRHSLRMAEQAIYEGENFFA